MRPKITAMRMIGKKHLWFGLGATLFLLSCHTSKRLERISSHDGLAYVWIESGPYFTGSTPDDTECIGRERRRQRILIEKGFWMGKTEVTQAAYVLVMDRIPADIEAHFILSSRSIGSLPVATAAGWVCDFQRSRNGSLGLLEV